MGSDPQFWLVSLGVAFLMEPWSMWVHSRLWHGVLWWGHKSHHEPRKGSLEINDAFAAAHAPLAMFLIIYGYEAGHSQLHHMLIAIGFGMTLFGLSYFLVHDGFIHGRLPLGFLEKSAYFRRVRNAHNAHHLREHVPPYGLFLGPQEIRLHQHRRAVAREAQPPIGRPPEV
jgi:beta-carotene 3-hydroxylase